MGSQIQILLGDEKTNLLHEFRDVVEYPKHMSDSSFVKDVFLLAMVRKLVAAKKITPSEGEILLTKSGFTVKTNLAGKGKADT